MRTIDAELTAEQTKLRLRPALGATVGQNGYEFSRIRWAETWAGSLTAQAYDMCIAGDGSAVLCRLSGGNVQVMRVADPASAASWAAATWTTVAAGTTGANPCVWSNPQAGASVYVCYCALTDRRIWVAASADYGATFGAPATVYTYASTGIRALAGCMRASGTQDNYIFCAWVSAGVTTWNYFRFTGGAWGAPVAITGWPAAYAVQGLDLVWESDFLAVVAGQTTASGNGARLWWAVLGDGGTYTAGTGASGVLEATDVTGFLYYSPSLVAGEHIRLGYLETYTGTGAYRRQQLQHLVGVGAEFNLGRWCGPEPFNYEPGGAWGACFAEWQAAGTTTLTVMLPGGNVQRGTVGSYDTLTSRIVRYEYREDVDSDKLIVDFDNADGALDDCGSVGSGFPNLRAGSFLALTHGLSVAGTDYTDVLAWFQVMSMFRVSERGRSLVEVHSEGLWGQLDEWHARRAYQWAAGSATLAAMLSSMVGRIGARCASKGALGSAFYGAFSPAVVIGPGTSGKAAVGRLVGLGPDVVVGVLGTLSYRGVSRSEAAVYSVGGVGEHPILRGHFQEGGIAGNAFDVYGVAAAMGASFEYPDIEAGGVRRRKVSDGAYAAAADAATRASGEKEKAYQTYATGWLECLPIHGLELWDVLSVTYAVLGISGRRYRVCALRESCDRNTGRYMQRVGLAALE